MTDMAEGRLVIQQCLKARLQVKPPNKEEGAEYVQIGRGIIIYVCFLSGASEDTVERMVKSAINVKLCETEDKGLISVLDLPGDILIIPQACLGGKLKGKSFQYHGIIKKADGLQLYEEFIQNCEKLIEEHEQARGKINVKYGTYGNRQVLNVETNGPFTHVIDF